MIPARPPGLDPGLTEPELFAIRRALVVETNPNHLVGFASSLSPQYPTAASLLYAKSALLELRPRAKQAELLENASRAARSLASLLERASGGVWSGERAVRWIATPMDAGGALSNLILTETGWEDAAAALRRVSPPPVTWPRFERLRAAADAGAAIAARRLQNGSFLPLSAVALAQPIDAAEAARNPLAARLQALGFAEAYPLTAGPDLAARSAEFQRAAIASQQSGVPIRTVLLRLRRVALRQSTPQIEETVKQAAGDLIVNPAAPLSEMSPAVRDLARAIILEIGPDVRIIDPVAARLVLSPSPPSPPSADRARWLRVFHREAALSR